MAEYRSDREIRVYEEKYLNIGMNGICVKQASATYKKAVEELKSLLVQACGSCSFSPPSFTSDTRALLEWSPSENLDEYVSWERLTCLLYRIADEFTRVESRRVCLAVTYELVRIIDSLTFRTTDEQAIETATWPGVTRSNLPKLLDGSLLNDHSGVARDVSVKQDRLLLANAFLSADGKHWLKEVGKCAAVLRNVQANQLLNVLNDKMQRRYHLTAEDKCDALHAVLELQQHLATATPVPATDVAGLNYVASGHYDPAVDLPPFPQNKSKTSRRHTRDASETPQPFFESYIQFVTAVYPDAAHCLNLLVDAAREVYDTYDDYAAAVDACKTQRVAEFHADVYRDWTADDLRNILDEDGCRVLRIAVIVSNSQTPLTIMRKCKKPSNFEELKRDARRSNTSKKDKLVEKWLHKIF